MKKLWFILFFPCLLFGQVNKIKNYQSLPMAIFDWTIEKAGAVRGAAIASLDSAGFLFAQDGSDEWYLKGWDTDGNLNFNLDITDGDLILGGDLTITGDDLFMTTNTSGYILRADGTNYNPVKFDDSSDLAGFLDDEVGTGFAMFNTAASMITSLTVDDGFWMGISGSDERIVWDAAGTVKVNGANLLVDNNARYKSLDGQGVQRDMLFMYTDNNVYLDAKRDLIIRTATNTEAMRIDSANQYIGFGVTDPDTRVEILFAGNQLKLSYDGTDNTTIGTDGSGDVTFLPSGGDILFSATNLTMTQATGTPVNVILEADASEDNSDTWQFLIADGDEFAIQTYAGGSYADALTIVGSTLAADFPGALTAGSVISDAGVGGTTITASTGFALGDGDYIGITGNEIISFASAGSIDITGADFSYDGHKDGQVFTVNSFQYPAPASDWSAIRNGAYLPAERTLKKVFLILNFLKIGDEITTFKVVGDATETNALTLDGQLYSIDKADPITSTAITNGAMTQVDAGGNFDVVVNNDDVTVATDKQYMIEFLATTGVGDIMTIMGVEVTINRK